MKKQYVCPIMRGERFTPNEYVAGCGDSGTVYKFKCDAGDGVPGAVYLETNGTEGLQTSGKNPDKYLSGYYACGTTHEAESTDTFLNGYYVVELWGKDIVTPVIVWRGPKSDNTHCTTILDMESWETAKS